MKIENRTFIVSGGSSGLGLATVQDLIQHGAYIAILDISPPPPSVVSSSSPSSSSSSPLTPSSSSFPSTSETPRALFVQTDIRDVAQIQDAVTRTVAWMKVTGAVLGGVINCAGLGRNELMINSKGKAHSTDIWDLTMSVNVTGTFNLTRLALEHLVHVEPEPTADGERGVVIMVASVAAFEGQPGQTAYAASKGALRSMTLPMARDLARHHIRVVTLAPGPFTTPLTGQLSDKVHTAIIKAGVLYPKRYGTPGEFAETVRWAIGCAYVNGETVGLTGGGRIPAFL
ncbi:3-hydroxyacyl-CoA dehydrogenase type-2 [Hypsizygus marmoreus]|uniref:3-hydroxyacyl-CoA dehydrogenase type-2 n=1 Tax=Hypsizygus marmoreus TaxID=39966 RepID=A0A369JW14_HYPMA|nr:3-hydroxyacyl-CoA dehydrogenase type-2 [Hypsizygus marmoreus]